MNITVVFPTSSEAQYLKRDDVNITFCGVGLIASTYGTYKAILDTKPDFIIMAGIAGVYPGVDLSIGDTVMVAREYQSDLGLFGKNGFAHLGDGVCEMGFDPLVYVDSPYASEQILFPTAVSNSMNCGLAPFVKTQDVQIENMEGAGFFHVANELGVPFCELRTISNVVDVNDDAWDFETSVTKLTEALNKLIDSLIK